jgi:hypothetical protein
MQYLEVFIYGALAGYVFNIVERLGRKIWVNAKKRMKESERENNAG